MPMAFDIPNWTGKYRIGSENLILKEDNCDSKVEFFCVRALRDMDMYLRHI